jgi:hypothetical protein
MQTGALHRCVVNAFGSGGIGSALKRTSELPIGLAKPATPEPAVRLTAGLAAFPQTGSAFSIIRPNWEDHGKTQWPGA